MKKTIAVIALLASFSSFAGSWESCRDGVMSDLTEKGLREFGDRQAYTGANGQGAMSDIYAKCGKPGAKKSSANKSAWKADGGSASARNSKGTVWINFSNYDGECEATVDFYDPNGTFDPRNVRDYKRFEVFVDGKKVDSGSYDAGFNAMESAVWSRSALEALKSGNSLKVVTDTFTGIWSLSGSATALNSAAKSKWCR